MALYNINRLVLNVFSLEFLFAVAYLNLIGFIAGVIIVFLAYSRKDMDIQRSAGIFALFFAHAFGSQIMGVGIYASVSGSFALNVVTYMMGAAAINLTCLAIALLYCVPRCLINAIIGIVKSSRKEVVEYELE
jgi:hypothetical protein